MKAVLSTILLTTLAASPVREGRYLSVETRPEWSGLFLRMETDGAVRERLALAYERAGYATAARFLQQRAPGDSLRGAPRDERSTSVWGCPDQPSRMPSILAGIEEVAELTVGGRHREALRRARSLRTAEGNSCLVLAQWADAVLSATMVDERLAASEEQEAAFRILVTAHTDVGARHRS